MARIKGITITLYDEVETGDVDVFGVPVTETKPIKVDNILIKPSSSEDIINSKDLYGRLAVYTLAIPKGDTHDWENKVVEFFGSKFRTFGAVTQGIESLIPLDWNKKIQVERYG